MRESDSTSNIRGQAEGARILLAKSNLEAGFGAVKPRRKPEDFKRLRRLATEEAARKALNGLHL